MDLLSCLVRIIRLVFWEYIDKCFVYNIKKGYSQKELLTVTSFVEVNTIFNIYHTLYFGLSNRNHKCVVNFYLKILVNTFVTEQCKGYFLQLRICHCKEIPKRTDMEQFSAPLLLPPQSTNFKSISHLLQMLEVLYDLYIIAIRTSIEFIP